MAYADLGGLGAKQGAPAFYDWVAPSIGPQLLPWLAILALMLLKSNRCGSAWWIWVPLGLVGGLAWLPEAVLEYLPSADRRIFLESISALGFGAAAVWLLAGWVAWKHRMLALVGILVPLGAFAALAFLIRQGFEEMEGEAVPLGVFVAVSTLVISVALTLAGLVCRGRYGGLQLSLWLVAALAVLWLLVFGPFFLIATIAGLSDFPFSLLLAAVGVASGSTFGVVLPFLVLSFANGFYRERLKGLLHLGAAAPPPVIAPPVPAVPAAA